MSHLSDVAQDAAPDQAPETVGPELAPEPAELAPSASEPAPEASARPAHASHIAATPSTTRRTVNLAGSLREGITRFPAVAALLLVAFAIAMLSTFELLDLDLSFFSSEGLFAELDNSWTELETYVLALRAACLLAVPVAMAAQLWGERKGNDPAAARRLQLRVAVAAVVVCWLLTFVGSVLNRELLLAMMRYGVSLASILILPWLLMTRNNEHALIPKLTGTVLYVALLSLVLFCGLCISTLAAEVLIFGGGGSLDRLYEVAIYLCWTLLAPLMLCGLLPHHSDELTVSRLFNGAVGYVVYPLCLLLLAVLYGYIGKIAAQQSMPSGYMNWFGSFALLVWSFLWMSLRDLSWRPARLFVRWGWLLLLPVVAVQVLGIAIRLRAYGLTTLRYAGLLCLATGLVALVLAAAGRSPRAVFALAAAVTLVGSLTPANVVDVPNYEQTRRLRGELAAAGLLGEDGLLVEHPSASSISEETAERIVGSWDYLRFSDRGYLSDRMINDLRKRGEGRSAVELFGLPQSEKKSGWRSYYVVSDEAGVDVTGFARAYDLEEAVYPDRRAAVTSADWEMHASWDNAVTLDLDLEETVDTLATRVLDAKDSLKDSELTLGANELRISCGEGRVLALTEVVLETKDDEVTEASFTGYLLVP